MTDLHAEEKMSDAITHCECSGNKAVSGEKSLSSSLNTAATEEVPDDCSLEPGNTMLNQGLNTDPRDEEELHLDLEKLTTNDGGEEETIKTTKVSFSSVQVKLYPYILGDNPSVSKGSPLTIDWEPMAVRVYDSVDAYETARGGEDARRDQVQLLIPADIRETYIRQTDYTPNERRLARKAINICKSHRKTTDAKDDKQSKSDYAIEKSVRAIRNVTWGRGSKQKERQLLEKARQLDHDREDDSSLCSSSSLKK
eukprot:CAMPEP_0198297598 /NCGR_PEP_ID=MMETSP1449-20131203/37375_1 /TAXON_ID=420275 /ORGANISM="Attheya septentrionalis, Strain CCMP2084" /LENGTH=253 /DNA_ID=CAMNT_0043998579 /DNA_START=31 /DNA_END=792 /DNA_ORIENTATION=+